jgi:hypothetical protein
MKSFKYKFNLSFSSEETVFNPSTSHVSKKVRQSYTIILKLVINSHHCTFDLRHFVNN